MSTLQDIASILEETCSPEVVWLYGSRARGDSSLESDFDIAVALPLQAL